MKKQIIILALSFLVLISGSFFIWRLIARSTPPPTPRTHITIPEGWTIKEINALLQKEGILVGETLPDDLEGYLFPDTYEFFLDSSLEVVQKRFEENFQEKIALVDTSGYELGDLVTMASIIQKEVHDPKEMRIVSGILWKRLQNDIALQVDATFCYMKLQRGAEDCLPITKDDKQVNSPYNTYLYRGLPPGPIGSPGLDALKAAADPAESPYWYYISESQTGRSIFAQTLDEHNSNIVKYLSE